VVILRSNELKIAQEIANAVKGLAILLPALAIGLFALAVYLARGRRRRTLRTTGWCFVLIGAALLLIRRVAGDAVVNGLVTIPSNQPAADQVWNIGTSLLRDIAVAMIVYGIVIVASAWLAGPTRPATEIRKALAPSLRDSPAVVYSSVGGVLVLLVLIGPTPAFRSIVWILVFAVLLAYGVTILRRQTALEFAGIHHGQALRDFRDQHPPVADRHELRHPRLRLTLQQRNRISATRRRVEPRMVARGTSCRAALPRATRSATDKCGTAAGSGFFARRGCPAPRSARLVTRSGRHRRHLPSIVIASIIAPPPTNHYRARTTNRTRIRSSTRAVKDASMKSRGWQLGGGRALGRCGA
jgi:hypothetical protein